MTSLYSYNIVHAVTSLYSYIIVQWFHCIVLSLYSDFSIWWYHCTVTWMVTLYISHGFKGDIWEYLPSQWHESPGALSPNTNGQFFVRSSQHVSPWCNFSNAEVGISNPFWCVPKDISFCLFLSSFNGLETVNNYKEWTVDT